MFYITDFEEEKDKRMELMQEYIFENYNQEPTEARVSEKKGKGDDEDEN